MMNSGVYKLSTGVYVVLSKICAFGDDGEGGWGVRTVDGEYYDADEGDIKMIERLLA